MHPSPSTSSSSKPTIPKGSFLAAPLLLVMLVLLSLAYAYFIITDSVPLLGLVALPLLWLAFWVANHSPGCDTPLNLPLLLLLLFLALAFALSIDRAASRPALLGVLLGMVFFFLIVNLFRRRLHVPLVIAALLLLALGATLLALVGTDWPESGPPILRRVTAHLPPLIRSLTGEGINKNTIGGALAFFPALLLSLLWDNRAFRELAKRIQPLENLSNFVFKFAVAAVLVLSLFALLLTQSRGALLGTAVSLLAVAIWKDRRFLIAIPLILALSAFAFFTLAKGDFSQFVLLLESTGEATFAGRVEIWRKALYLIQDFPFTGIGQNTFGQVFQRFYTYTIFPYPDPFLFHPHNTFLSVAVDLGLPALVLFAALLGGLAAMAFSVARSGRSISKVLAIGLSCGLLGHLVFGVMDAFSLGKNLGVIMWIYFALLTALFVHQSEMRHTHPDSHSAPFMDEVSPAELLPENLKRALVIAGFWLLISLTAIAFITLAPLFGVGIAVVGGILIGTQSVRVFYSQ